MKTKYKLIAGSLLVGLSLFGAIRFYYSLTDDFRVTHIKHELNTEQWQTPALSSQEQQSLSKILQQKFYYLGKGAQCYAFVSQDDKYVIKFFKFKHLKPNWLVDLIPPLPFLKDYKKNAVRKKQRKIQNIFASYSLVYRENKEESQLIYVHLAPTKFLNQTLHVVNKIGVESHINLDDVVFLVQHKGETFGSRIQRDLSQDSLKSAKSAITNIIAMYISEYKKGLYDRDHDVIHNTGFVGEKAFHLDSGKFSKDDTMRLVEIYKNDLEHVLWKIASWIQLRYPQYQRAIFEHLSQQYYLHTGLEINVAEMNASKFDKKHRKAKIEDPIQL